MLSSKYVLQHVLLTEYLTLNRSLSFPETRRLFINLRRLLIKTRRLFLKRQDVLKRSQRASKTIPVSSFFKTPDNRTDFYFHTYLPPSFYLPDSLINEVIQAFSVSDFSRTSVSDYYSVGT